MSLKTTRVLHYVALILSLFALFVALAPKDLLFGVVDYYFPTKMVEVEVTFKSEAKNSSWMYYGTTNKISLSENSLVISDHDFFEVGEIQLRTKHNADVRLVINGKTIKATQVSAYFNGSTSAISWSTAFGLLRHHQSLSDSDEVTITAR